LTEKGLAVKYDLYRLQDGKIAEHWDTLESIPPRHEMEERKRQVLVGHDKKAGIIAETHAERKAGD